MTFCDPDTHMDASRDAGGVRNPSSGHRESMNEMSQKLLEGWTMLSTICPVPNCNTPLLRSRSNELYCAGCRLPCRTEESVENGNSNCAAAPGLSAAVDSNDVGRTDDSDSETEEERAQRHRAVLGRYFESAMLRQREEGEEGEGGRRGIQAEEEVSSDATALAREANEEQLESRRRHRDAASNRIGEKLLQGWTMLADHCEREECSVPLLRDRQGKVHCVSCNRVFNSSEEFVSGREEASQQQQQQQQQQRLEQPRQARSTTPIERPVAGTRESAFTSSAQSLGTSQTRNVATFEDPAPIPTQRQLPPQTHPSPSAADFFGYTSSVKASSVYSLCKKMEETRQRLDLASDGDAILALARQMKELAETIKAIQSLQ